jgi:large-conductance mechanosensitive channel
MDELIPYVLSTVEDVTANIKEGVDALKGTSNTLKYTLIIITIVNILILLFLIFISYRIRKL